MKLALALSLLAAPSASGFGMEHGDHNDAAVAPGGDEDTYEEKFDCQDFSQPEEASEDMSDYCKEQEGCYWQPFDAAGGFTTGYGYGGECLPGDASMVVMSCEESYGEAECLVNPKECYYNPDDMSCSQDPPHEYEYEADPNKPTTCGEIDDETICNEEAFAFYYLECAWQFGVGGAPSYCVDTSVVWCGEIDDETICNEEAFALYFLNCAWQSGAGGAPSYCVDTSGDVHTYGDTDAGCDQSVCNPSAMSESECGEGCVWMDAEVTYCKCADVCNGFPPCPDGDGGCDCYGDAMYGSDSSGYGTDTNGGNPNTDPNAYGDCTCYEDEETGATECDCP